jgi:hypothetical protein
VVTEIRRREIMRAPRVIVVAFTLATAGCATFPEPTFEQRDLSALVQPYATQLAAECVSRIEVPASGGGYISVGTPYGFFEIRGGGDVAPAPFVVVYDDSARVLSDSYKPADLPKYRATIDRIVPEVLRVAPRNEAAIHELQSASH